MLKDCNVIGRKVSQLRWQREWTQETLVAKLQVLGCYMTRDILASIETRRCIATDKQIEFFAEAFGIQVQQLFPAVRHFIGKPLEDHEGKYNRRRKKSRLAPRRKK